jgi:hypothetical protein
MPVVDVIKLFPSKLTHLLRYKEVGLEENKQLGF